ncbi:DUF4345 domain-containing protein [Streptomyces sp. SID5785]|uniref:DUF4345 domain-containing protein n=1 Tax=Streptomyces sp. SID5785 TaxID=2690309 RepID=UPI001360EDDA|nr:DUF4345 domain-containing protein [Streptomyces sp. SID5785]MZD04427.1 DUF4345 domain-containing protein [Streptomyces sp. SID5785]
MARTLRVLTLLMGWACVAIGLFHVALGNAAIPGAGSAGATIDSWGRFMGASFVGYGLAWLWAARRRPIPAGVIRWLAVVFLLGAVGRLISLAVAGRPQWFQLALTVIEIVLPPVFLLLADAEEKAVSTDGAAGSAERPRTAQEGRRATSSSKGGFAS